MSTLRGRILAVLGAAPALVTAACLEPEDKTDEDDDGSLWDDTGDGGDSGSVDPNDRDGDGYTVADGDCNDNLGWVHPGAEELCNGQDDDCDDEIDEGAADYLLWPDADGDGWGANTDPVETCTWAPGLSWETGDCDDTDPAIHPYAFDDCDGVDDDCDGVVDNDTDTALTDEDGDGWYGTWFEASVCDELPEGAEWYDDVWDRTDCDDTNALANPDQEEICFDGFDNDCNGYETCREITQTSSLGECVATVQLYWGFTYDDAVCSTCSFTVDLYYARVGADTAGTCDDEAQPWERVTFASGVPSLDSRWAIETQGWDGDVFDLTARDEFESAGETITESLHLEMHADEIYVYRYYYYYEGRPFTVGGAARFAIPTGGRPWGEATATLQPPEAVRERVAAVWAAAGRAEHASVASFARFALELMALGAPADLLAGASRAMADEVAHARACFGIVAGIRGVAPDVGALDVRDSLAAAGDATASLRALIHEGCVGETLSAARAERALAGAVDPTVRAALQTIVSDEARHATYAWRCARWLLATRPDLKGVARAAFAEARPIRRPAGPDPLAAALAPWGVMDADTREAVAQETWDRVVVPAMAALLGEAAEAYVA